MLPWGLATLVLVPVLPPPDEADPGDEEVPVVVVPVLLGVLVSVLASGLLVLVLLAGELLLLGWPLLEEVDDDGVLLLSLSLSLSLSFDVEEPDELEEDVSAYTIVVATEELTINATISRNNPKLTENSAIFLLAILCLCLPYYRFLAYYLKKSKCIQI